MPGGYVNCPFYFKEIELMVERSRIFRRRIGRLLLVLTLAMTAVSLGEEGESADGSDLTLD